MRIENIDKNFAHGTAITKDGMVEYAIPHENFALYGIFYDKKDCSFLEKSRDRVISAFRFLFLL